MFFLKTVALLAAVTFVTAIPAPGDDGSQCNTGTQQCCESVQKASEVSETVVGALEGLVSFILTDANTLLGLDCSPISVVGILSGNTGCDANPVCCDGTQESEGSIIGINCIPISVS